MTWCIAAKVADIDVKAAVADEHREQIFVVVMSLEGQVQRGQPGFSTQLTHNNTAIDEYLQTKSVWVNLGRNTGNPFVMKTSAPT